MAPRFKQLLFQTYAGGRGANAFIGFPVNQFEQMSPFRNALRDEFEKITGFKYRIDIIRTNVVDPIDVCVKFFDGKDADTVNAFYSKPWPGCFSWLFRTRYYREHKEEEIKVKPLIKIEISTSHDYPCVVVDKSVFTEDAIAQIIEKVAHDLNLKIVRSKFPLPMAPILMSNSSFDAREQGA
jgi:hypothetical protein